MHVCGNVCVYVCMTEIKSTMKQMHSQSYISSCAPCLATYSMTTADNTTELHLTKCAVSPNVFNKVRWQLHRATSHPVHHVSSVLNRKQQSYISPSVPCLQCVQQSENISTELQLTQRATSRPVWHVSSVFNSKKTTPQSYISPSVTCLQCVQQWENNSTELHLTQCAMSPSVFNRVSCSLKLAV